MVLPRLLLFWLSDTVTELLQRASNPRMPPTQSPRTHTCTGGSGAGEHAAIPTHTLTLQASTLTWPLNDSPSKDLMKSLYT